MKKIIFASALLFLTLGLYAQTTDSIAAPENKNGFVRAMENVGDAIVKWDTETMLDSLDQEDLPKMVTGGLFIGGNMSDFLITRQGFQTMASHRRVGAELGGFIDFTLSKHFAIQPQVIFTAHQNFFADTVTTNRLWSFGMEIPVYFLGRFGNMKQGYVQFGGGIFTHFTFASNIGGKYKSVDQPTPPEGQEGTAVTEPEEVEEKEKDGYSYTRLYTLHNNHFGICAMVGYEFPFGLQINAQYKISLSDIAGFYNEYKGKPIADALIYPHSISLCVGYRFK